VEEASRPQAPAGGLFSEGESAPHRESRSLVRPARILGRVLDGAGRPVASAKVVGRGTASVSGRSADNGTFVLDGLAPGGYVLFAGRGVEASDPVGPIPVAPGEELREVLLILATGAALGGLVLDLRDGRPIALASVSAGSASAVTDERGRYVLKGLPEGTVSLAASASGYMPRVSEVSLQRGRMRSGADLHLERAARVHGRVMSGGLPIAGAQVLCASYGFGSRLSILQAVAITDSDGRFAGGVSPGRLELVAQVGGYAEARTEELDLSAGDDREANLTLGPGGVVFGSVRDAALAGVSGCRVNALDAVHGRVTAQGTTGPDGRYWLSGVPTALYVVSASCAAGHAERAGVRVLEGDSAQVDLEMGGASVAGKVTDGQGRPLAGAQVSVRLEGSLAPEEPIAASRADGSFEVTGLSGARFTVSAQAATGRAERAGIPAGARDVVLSVATGELVGLVVSDRGDPVPDFVVYAEPQRLDPVRPRSQRFLSPTGEFRLSLAPARYSIKVGAPGHAPIAPIDVEVPAGGGGSRVKVVLPRGRVIRGRVVSEKGQPIENVRVATHPNLLWAFGRAAPVSSGAYTVSENGGVFTLAGAPAADRVSLFAQRDGFEQRGPQTVTLPRDGAAEGVELRLFASRGDEGMEREFGGVGMTLGEHEKRFYVNDVFFGGPARDAGVRPGDEVLAVDGIPTRGLSMGDVIARIRGVVGTPVSLRLVRENREFSVTVARAEVKF
jgi:protocatechuate 3,4-dioxygenase beta subunit